MKKVFFTLMAALLFFSGCNKTKQFTVTLNLEDADNESIYLCKEVDGKTVSIDSAVVTKGQAVLKADFDDPQTCYIIKTDPKDKCGIFPFFTENQNTTIKGGFYDMPHWVIKGCPTMNALNEFHQKSLVEIEDPIMAYNEGMNEAYRDGDTVQAEEIYNDIMTLVEAYYDNQMEFIRSHSDSYIGHYMLDEMKQEIELDKVKDLYEGLTNESVYRQHVKEYIEKNERVEVGAPFIDFTLKTADGDEVNLEKVINYNQVVMVDFWASWCGPCRGENPYVKAAYEKYHAAGFEIIGVSVDKDEAAWQKAVADDGMSWIQVRDADNTVAPDYMIQYIPSNFLYDANGVMIAKGLRGEDLEAKLAEVLQ